MLQPLNRKSVAALTMLALVLFEPVAFAADDGRAERTGQASSFFELMNWVRLGETVFLIDDEGVEIKGTLEDVSAEDLNLVIRVDGAPLTLAEERVRRIDLEVSDSLGDGALWGLGVGLGLAAALAVGCDNEWAFCFGWFALTTGSIGLGVGVGVDALVKDRRLVYMSDAATTPLRFRLSPLITPTDKGVQLSLTW